MIPEEIAKIMKNQVLSALSILTEKKYFLGEIDHISLVKKKLIYQY